MRPGGERPNTYKASLVKCTQFDDTGWGGPRQIRRLQHRAVLTFISKSVQMFCTKHLSRLCDAGKNPSFPAA
jgi:hypothetical protein